MAHNVGGVGEARRRVTVQLSTSLAQTDLAKMPISTSWLRSAKCLLLFNIEVHHHRRLKVVYLSFHYS